MNIISVIMVTFSLLGALDRIFGNRLGLGKEFERGFNLLGAITLSMAGMLIVAPLIGNIMLPFAEGFHKLTGIDPSIIPASFLANDMGGEPLATQLAINKELGGFNGFIVASMMGVIVSFNIPYAIGAVKKELHRELFLGILSGIATVPVGCFVAGLMLKLPLALLLLDLLPLVVFAAVISLGLVFIPDVCVKIFKCLGIAIKVLVTVGLALGILKFLTGLEPIKGLAPIEGEPMLVCFNAAIFMSGAFPLLALVSKLLKKPFKRLGELLGINDIAALCFVASLATNVTSFELMGSMNKKGVMLNAAFAMAGAFTFADHLAYTMARDGRYIFPMIVGKLIAGICSIAVAALVYNRINKKEVTENEG
jgi:ethanolamine transporter